MTRPDISLAVARVSRYTTDPSEHHWNALKRIVRYLKCTRDHRLHISALSDQRLALHVDADHAGCLDTRKSTSRVAIYLDNTLITWICRRQTLVALSTTKAEYVALAEGLRQSKWINQLLSKLGISPPRPMIYSDNESAISTARNTGLKARAKHFDIHLHFIRDELVQERVDLAWISTKEQRADVLTRPLDKNAFETQRSMLQLVNKTF